MVVQCPSCQSKFRIADEKVTDRGVRVRCTSCKDVFQARRPGAGAEPGSGPGTTRDLTSLAASPVGRATSRAPAAVRPPRAKATRSARAAESAARRLEADDLFGMAELTGDVPLPQVPLPTQVTKPVLRPESAFGDLELDLPAREPPSPAASLPPPPPEEDDGQEDEARKDEGRAAASEPSALDAAAPPPADAFDLGFGRSEAPVAPPAKIAEPSAPPAKVAEPAAPLAAASARAAEPEAAPARTLFSSALTGLLGAALAIAIVIASALSDGAARWLGLSARADVVATRVVSGLYDTAGGKPVFYVRGRVENRGPRVQGPVRVTAELLSEGASRARAEATAGAEPSAEEVWTLRTAADAERLERSLEIASVDRKLQPGGSLPFFALIADPPADLRGHRVRVSLEPMGGGNPSAAASSGAKDK